MIQGVSSYGYAQPTNYYAFGVSGRTHGDVISAVRPVKAITPLSNGTDRLRTVVSYESKSGGVSTISETRATAQDKRICTAYQQSSQADYNLSNPYETVRMATEGILLTGMNFDQLA